MQLRRWCGLIAVVLCCHAPLRAEDSIELLDGEMRRLWREYQHFKDRADFQQFGYWANGPYERWSRAVLALHEHRQYAIELMRRCDVQPFDLWEAGRVAYSGKTDDLRKNAEAKFTACFPR